MAHKVGWHLNNTQAVSGGDWGVLNAVPPSAVLNLPGGATPEDIQRVLEISPDCHVFIRPYFVPSDNDWQREKYIRAVETMVQEGHWQRVIPEGQRHLQIFNEQNMPHTAPVGHPTDQWEGFGPTEDAMKAFNNWFVQGYERIKAIDPSWKVGYTPLTIGNRDVYFLGDTENVPYYMHGPEAARPNPSKAQIEAAIQSGPCYQALMLADEYCAHIYCTDNPEVAMYEPWYGLRFAEYARFFPKPMDIWITETGMGGPAHAWGMWFDLLNTYPTVKGTCIWILGQIIRSTGDPAVKYLREYIKGEPIPEPEPEPEPPPDVDPDEVEQEVRNAAWASVGVPYNPDAAFPTYARLEGLGAPEAAEEDIEIGGVMFRYQPFVGGVVFCRVGDWSNVAHLEW